LCTLSTGRLPRSSLATFSTVRIYLDYCLPQKIEAHSGPCLTVLNILGRPLYWKGPTEEVASEVAEADAEAMEEDAMEEEEAFDDEEEDFSEEEDEEVDMGEEAEEENTSLNVAAFRRLVDVTNRWDTELSPESYACLQATTEDFLVSLIQASGRSTHFAGRREVTEEDVRFAQLMTQQKW
jgi:histone H3/H4